jgi:hypothetical protein
MNLFVSALCPRRKVEAPSTVVLRAHFEPERLCQFADSDKRQPAIIITDAPGNEHVLDVVS